jgi:hypothetical protein
LQGETDNDRLYGKPLVRFAAILVYGTEI